MKSWKRVVALALMLGMTAAGAQNAVPTSNPTAVMVKGRLVSHSWRDGRIWVPTSDLRPLLNLSTDAPSMDLLKALDEKGGYVWNIVDGRLEAKLDPSKFSQGGPSAAASASSSTDYLEGERRMLKAMEKFPKITSHRESSRVESIGQKIVAVSDMPTLKWNFLVLESSSPNAFCTGAGWVAVTDGLLALKLSDDELAGILAHEVGHGCRKDLEEAKYNHEQMTRHENDARRLDRERQGLIRQREAVLDKANLAQRLSRVSGSSGEAMAYASQAEKLRSEADNLGRKIRKLDNAIELAVKNHRGKEMLVTESVHHQKDEYDADIKGIYYATKAGYSSHGLMDGLKKIAHTNAEKFGMAAYQGGFTHPPVDERIKTMNKVLNDWKTRR